MQEENHGSGNVSTHLGREMWRIPKYVTGRASPPISLHYRIAAEFSGSETRRYNWISRFRKVCGERKHLKCPEESQNLLEQEM